jgi:FkbM family methyltransferase
MELIDTFVGKMWLLDKNDEAKKDEKVRVGSGYFVSQRIKQGDYENKELEIAKAYLKPGMNCIDVGANVGVYSVLAAQQIGAEGIVYAFEPFFGIYETLVKNSILYPNIKPFNVGLNNKVGVTYFKNIKELDLEVVIGDDILQNVEKVDFIKVDVDGAEPGVVEGLQNLIKRSPNLVMMCELSKVHYELAGFTELQFFNLVENLGFKYGRMFNGQIDMKSCKQLMNVSAVRACNILLWKGVEPFLKGV